jgi:glutamate/tyrosine decarboxylase-like PLP-dependent enzyme
VCAVGNVNTGALDPLRKICGIAHRHDARAHVDGASGLGAAATPSLRHLLDGVDLADSWATDAHKWLNVPYDCGIVLCTHPDSHPTTITLSADYLTRTGTDWTPESPHQAHAFPAWAGQTLRALTMMIGSRCNHHG